jgi:nuclear pore complex protein Nup133
MWEYSAVAADETGSERERKELDEKFGQLRPEVLETLRRWLKCCLDFHC